MAKLSQLFGITYLVGKIKFKLFVFRVHWLSEDYTTQLYTDYNKPLKGSLLAIQYFMESKRGFFVAHLRFDGAALIGAYLGNP